MTIWKSPVFYFGLFLVLLVGAALVAPFVVDWGQYRDDLEAYGSKLTGRKVAITGPIQVRFFPWPRLTADQVTVANPEGFGSPQFVAADQVVVQLTLGALMNGTIQVESIDVDAPRISLVRRKDGAVNWHLTPESAVRNSSLLDHVMLDQIHVSNGRISFADEMRASQAAVEEVSATLSAPMLAGPWRSSGTLDYLGAAYAFSASTMAYSEGAPLRFAWRVAHQDGSGYSLAFDGQDDAGTLTGDVRVAPAASPDGKSDTEGRLRPVTAKAKVVGDFNRLDFNEIEIRPADVQDQGTLISGDVGLVLGKKLRADAVITAPRIDFDVLAGAGSRQLLRDGGGLALVNGLLAAMPDIDLRTTMKVTALKAGGEVLENVSLGMSANREAIRIHELTAALPGRSKALFSGVFFPGTQFAELAGSLSLESNDLRALSQWVWPDSKDAIARTWTGSRGQLKAKSDVALTASKLEFKQVDYELDGQPGKVNFSMLVNGERPIVDIRIDTPAADVDNFLVKGLSTLQSSEGISWARLIQDMVAEQLKQDLRLTFQTGLLHLNGVDAQDVTLDLETTAKGFDLKTVEIGSVGGARLTASGVVLNTVDGLDGKIGVAIAAETPVELLRLGGMVAPDAVPVWTTALGKTAVNIDLIAKPAAGSTDLGFSVAGTSGDLTINSDGSFVAQASKGLSLNGSAEIASGSSASVVRLFGARPAAADSQAAHLVVTVDGLLSEGFITDLSGNAYGTEFHYAGQFKPQAEALGINGSVSLRSADLSDLITALQMPRAPGAAGSGSLQARLKAEGAKLTASDMTGVWAGSAFSGTAALEPGPVVHGDLTVEQAAVLPLMAQTFLPWNGKDASLDEILNSSLPLGVAGEIWIRPKHLTIYPGYVLDDAQIGITGTDKTVQFNAYAKDADGNKVTVEVNTQAFTDGHKADGALVVPFDLGQNLKLVAGGSPFAGQALVSVKFNGAGRSARAVLASLNGGGSFTLGDGRLLQLSPQAFSQHIRSAKDATDLQASFQALRTGEGLPLGRIFGAISIAGGSAAIAPFGTSTEDADIMVTPVVDLAEGNVDIGLHLMLKAMAELPAMDITYAGPPLELASLENNSALSSYLGFKVLNQGVQELEKVQAEQKRLAEEEAALRQQDEARLAAYYAQRAELRLRLRELRVQGEQRVAEAEQRRVALETLMTTGQDMNRAELRLRVRELTQYDPDKAGLFKPAPAQKPKPKPAPPPPLQVPLILVPPASPQ
jgi:hypothetical protein